MTLNADLEATVRFKRGIDTNALIDQMAADGIDREVAAVAVRKVQLRLTTQDRKRGFTNLVFGLLISAIGLTVTLATLSGGNIVVFAYGALLVGPGMVLLGLSQMVNAGKDSELARR